MTRLKTFVATLMLAACQPTGGSETALRIVIDSAGPYPIVESLGEAPGWNATLLHEIGATGSDVEFGSIRSVLLDRRGRTFVVDPSNRAIQMFDSTGMLLRQVGRSGSGPGEYRTPYSIAWLGDQLAVLDPGNARISLFDSTEVGIATWPVPPITGGNLVRLYRTPPRFWSLALRLVEGRTGPVLVQYSSDGPVDTMPLLQLPPGEATGLRRCARPDDATTFFAAPFGDALVTIPTPAETQAVVRTSRYRVALVDRRGDTVRVLQRNIAPTPITDAEWDSANGDWARFRREWPTAECDRGDFPRPAVKPPVVALFHDDEGHLWVEIVTPEGPRYEVFDENGRLVARVTGLPASTGIDPSVVGYRMVLVGQDSLDAPVVRVYRISR